MHLEIDTKGKLSTKLYDKRDDFIFPIVNFTFLSINILSAPAYGVHVSQLICYSRACGEYYDVLLDRASRLTRKLQRQGYVAPKLLSSLNKFYAVHHVLVDICLSDGYWFGFVVELLGFISPYRTWLPPDWPWLIRRVCCNRQELLTLPEHLGSFSFDRELISLAFVCTLCILGFVSFCCLLFSCFLGLYNVFRLPLWFFFPFFVISLFNNRFSRYRMETYMFILTKLNRRKSSNNCTGPHREDID